MLATQSHNRTQGKDTSDRNALRYDIAYSENNIYGERITRPTETKKTNNLPSRLITGLLEDVITYFNSLRVLSNSAHWQIERQPLPNVSVMSPRTDENFNLVLGRLANLLRPTDEDEIVPASHAFEIAWDLISSARQCLPSTIPFPKAGIGIDDSGTIFVGWRQRQRKVHLAIPSEPGKHMYIYHEEGNVYTVEYSVTGRSLARWLEWYAEA